MFYRVLKIFQEFDSTKELRLPNIESIFPLILRIFDHECNGQTSLNVAFVMFGPVFMKVRKLKNTHCENKTFDIHKTFSLFKSFCSMEQNLFSGCYFEF